MVEKTIPKDTTFLNQSTYEYPNKPGLERRAFRSTVLDWLVAVNPFYRLIFISSLHFPLHILSFSHTCPQKSNYPVVLNIDPLTLVVKKGQPLLLLLLLQLLSS